jgi:sulfofructose kinase
MEPQSKMILVVGYNAYDTIIPFGGLPSLDAKHEVESFFEGGGGPGATAAVALRRLGAEVQLLTPLADDRAGRLQRRELEAAGVDLGNSPVVVGHTSPRAVILADESTGYRTIFWTRGDVPRLDENLADPRLLDGVDLLYIDGHEPAVSCRLAQMACDRGVPIVMDAGSVRDGSRELVTLCTDVISSMNFAPDLTEMDDPLEALRALRKMGPARVGLTAGPSGVLGLDEAGVHRIPAFDVPVRDTTGAGDVFHAGYAWALVSGSGFDRCLEYGAAAAALSLRDWGGRRGLPTAAEVAGLIATGHRRSLGHPLDDPST